MSCTDCKGSTPTSLWKRCVECAMNRLRHLMSGGQVSLRAVTRKFSRGDVVTVTPLADEAFVGKVVHIRGDRYAVAREDGSRYHAHFTELGAA